MNWRGDQRFPANFIVFFVLLLSPIFFLGYSYQSHPNRTLTGQPASPSSSKNLPACPAVSAGLLTHPIIASEAYNFITPLGNLNSDGGHIIPTDHMYIANTVNDDRTVNAEVFAAGDMVLTALNESRAYDEQGTLISSAVNFTFQPCKEISLEYEVTDLAPDFTNELETVKQQAKADCSNGQKLHGRSRQCKYQINYRVKAGQLLGTTNRVLDIGAVDTRVTLPFINPRRYSDHTLHAICPFDLYTETLKAAAYATFGGHSDTEPNHMTHRTAEPRCGQVMQDLLGTAQGEWFADVEPSLNAEFDGRVISLVHDNVDPSVGAIISGPDITETTGTMHFTPTNSGTKNREWSEVKTDGVIYCYSNWDIAQVVPHHYSNEDERINGALSGRIILTLINQLTMQIEYQQRPCDGTEQFSSPKTYHR